MFCYSMYVALTHGDGGRKLYIALIVGDDAFRIHRWQTIDGARPHDFTLHDVPTMTMTGSNLTQYQSHAIWTMADLRVSKWTVERNWGTPSKRQRRNDPHQVRRVYHAERICQRQAFLTVPDRPAFNCTGWDAQLVPNFELFMDDVNPARTAELPCSIIQISEVGQPPEDFDFQNPESDDDEDPDDDLNF